MDRPENQPTLFSGNGSFAQDVTRGIVLSEIEGGVYLSEIQEGEVLVVETENRSYRIERLAGRAAYISGHPQFCPVPTRFSISGSSWGGSMLEDGLHRARNASGVSAPGVQENQDVEDCGRATGFPRLDLGDEQV
jgi:hypothetical protein